MLRENYPWQRLWCSPDGRLRRTEEGYTWEAGEFNKEVVTLESEVGVPCLILLGEPGMGKSRTMDAWRQSIDEVIRAQGDITLAFDLRSYASPEWLVRSVFENPDFVKWRNDKNVLHLFLDSLDEGLLRIETLSSLLAEEFLKCDAKRLMVRIACRSADWQSPLETVLEHHWGKGAVKQLEIVPLTHRDIETAAKIEGIDASAFMKEVFERGIGPFAAKPVTLRHLLRIYVQRGEFPASQWRLYEEGCQLLCDEPRQTFARTRLKEEFVSERRIMVAGRIAALTMFGNRATILIDNPRESQRPEDFISQDLRGGYESVDDVRFEIGDFEIRETLNTGLFSLRGAERLGWSHQTYAEFLAAWYLNQHRLSTPQLMSLLVHPGDQAGKLVPQLREVAAWLASVNHEVRRNIAKIEPNILLQSDLSSISDSEKADLVSDLLALYDDQRDYLRDWSIYRKLHKLKHPTLGEQLRPFINDQSKKFLVRHIAIEIADVCNLSELQQDLTEIALNTQEHQDLRSYAAMAVAHIADEEFREKLRPLAEDSGDIEGKLKGWALKALWPNLMTATELFQLLDAPAEGYAGSYTSFLSSDFLEHLKDEDLSVALAWVEQQEGYHLDYYLQKIVDQIMFIAWDHLAEPVILDAFARAALSRLLRYTSIVADRFDSWGISTASPAERFETMLTAESSKRRNLIGKLLSLMTRPDDLLHSLSLIRNVVRKTDLEWIISQAREAENREVKVKWAKLLRFSWDPYSADDFDILFAACQEQPEFRNEFRYELTPVVLGSVEAQQMRVNWEMTHRKEQVSDRPVIDPPITERIEGMLQRCEAGDWDAWWYLNHLMRFEVDGTTKIHDSEADLTAMPGWQNAKQCTRKRIIEAAKGYILARDDTPGDWLEKWLIHYPAYAGYRGLCLIQGKAPEYLAGLTPETWKRWATIITLFPIDQLGEGPKSETDLYLMKQAYANASAEVVTALMAMIDQQNGRDGFFTIPVKMQGCIDDRLASAMLAKAKEPEIKPGTFHTLLKEALKHNSPGARKFAESFLSLPLSIKEGEKVFRATDVLLDDPTPSSWPLVWAAMQADTAFRQEVMERSASVHRTEKSYRWEYHLTDNALADLYILTLNTFPLAEDPHIVGFHGISTRELVTRWREGLLHELKGRGTTEACNAVARIIEAFPDYEYLKYALIDAQDLARRNTWHGVDVNYVFELLHASEKRLVENGEQLLRVVLESLQRFQQKLHDETPSVRDVWNEFRVPGKGREIYYTPKDEDAFSDVVKRHLDADLHDRGIVVNREVVIRRTTGKKDGERTDIHVDAVSKKPDSSYETVKIILEAKGCWNPDLKRAMKTQLMDRYLRENSCQHGLYLVGWYGCNQWHDSDHRKHETPFSSAQAASQYLTDQAKALSKKGTHIEALVIDASIR
jgi:predicted NACHT family NTPase